jgi:hypothetical protein
MPGKSAYFGSAIVILFTWSPYVCNLWPCRGSIHTHQSYWPWFSTRRVKLILVQRVDPCTNEIPERRSWVTNVQYNWCRVVLEHTDDMSMDPWNITGYWYLCLLSPRSHIISNTTVQWLIITICVKSGLCLTFSVSNASNKQQTCPSVPLFSSCVQQNALFLLLKFLKFSF